MNCETQPSYFPKHNEELIAPVLKDLEEFKRLISGNYDLLATAELFSNHAEELIAPVLKDPEELKRLITTKYELQDTAKLFPNHADILGQETVEDSVKVIERKLIKQKLIEQKLIEKRYPNGFFQQNTGSDENENQKNTFNMGFKFK